MSRFLYQRIKSELRRRIASGEYAATNRIPSESELVTAFKVSAITVRRAIRELIDEGMLVGHQGRGVFVGDTRRIVRSLAADSKSSLADDIRAAGLEPGVKALGLRKERADGEVAALLALEPGAEVYRFDKLLLGDEEPLARAIMHCGRALGDRLGYQLSEEFLLELLRSHSIPIDHVDFAIEGGAADEDDAASLRVRVGFPLLIVRYTPIAPDGSAILTSSTRSRYDRFTYVVSTPDPR